VFDHALWLSGDCERAEKQLTERQVPFKRLLLLNYAIENSNRDRMAELSGQILEATHDLGSDETERVFEKRCVPKSLEQPITRSVRWLAGNYPDSLAKIQTHFGDPDKLFSQSRNDRQIREYVPASQLITNLRKELATESAADPMQVRRQLVSVLVSAHFYAEAAAVPIDPPDYWQHIWKRHAAAEDFFAAEPKKIRELEFALKSYRNRFFNGPPPEGKEWLTDIEVTNSLIKLGPHSLASVLVAIGPNTISGLDRSAFVRVVQAIGDTRDIPVLESTLNVIERDLKRSSGRGSFKDIQDANDNNTIAHLRKAISELSTRNP
jgi:hypothetical protein